MANKKVSQLTSKPAVNLTDLFLIADPTSGQAFKTTISDLGTAIGSGVSSVNGLVGAVVLDTDDIQELASPTNRWFTDTRARAALSAASPLAYNSGTGVFSLPQANGSTNGFLSSADWTTFNAKQAALSGTGFVKISGTTISYDNSTYLTTSAAASTYLALSGGTLTGALNGTSATFTGDLTLSATNPRLYFTDTDNNPDYFISNTDGTFTIYDVTNSTSRFTIGTTGNGTFGGNLTVGQIIRSGGTSSQFLKADGSVDSTSYQPILTNPVTGTGTSGIVAKFSGTSAITDSIIYDNGTRVSIGANITTTNTFTSVSSTSSAYAVVAQASSSANGIWSNVLGTGEIFRGQTAGGSYFIINNGGNAFLNGNLNVGDFASTSFRLNVVGTANITGALSGTSATFSATLNVSTIASGLTAKIGSETDNAMAITLYGGSVAGNSNNVQLRFQGRKAAVDQWAIGNAVATGDNTRNFDIYDLVSGFNALRIAGGTGAATFSSSVTATQGIFRTDQNAYTWSRIDNQANNASAYAGLQLGAYGNTWGIAIGSSLANSNALNFVIDAGGTNSPKMTITSSGNVGIGTTAPTDYSGYTTLHVNGKSGTGSGVVRVTNALGTAGFNMYADNAATFNTTSAIPILFLTQDTERMRISSGGLVGIGTSSPSSYNADFSNLVIANTSSFAGMTIATASTSYGTIAFADGTSGIQKYAGYIQYSHTDDAMAFASNATERMRITSGGNVLIGGTTSASVRLGAFAPTSTGASYGLVIWNSGGADSFSVRGDGLLFSRGAYDFTTGGGANVNVDADGLVRRSTSSLKYKKNVETYSKGLNELMQMRAVSYNSKNENETQKYAGLIAEEVHELGLTEFVQYAKDGTPDALAYPNMVSLLVKSIQELKAELDTLKNK